MEAFTVRGLVVFLAVLHPGMSFIMPSPWSCQSGWKEYHLGEKWVENCHQCECTASMWTMMVAYANCSSEDVCTHSPIDGGLTSTTSHPVAGGPKLEHCLEVQDCHRYFDFCRTRLESTDCVHGTCQCMPDPNAHGSAPHCLYPSDCVSTAAVCPTLFEDAICLFGNCQCVPKGAFVGGFSNCHSDNECWTLSSLCQSQHGKPVCYHNHCLCEAEEPCFYEGRAYEQHEVWTDKERCKSCVCSDTGSALCHPLSNTTACLLHSTTTMAVFASASAEPTTTTMKQSTSTVPSTTTTKVTTTKTTIQTTTEPTTTTMKMSTTTVPSTTTTMMTTTTMTIMQTTTEDPSPVITFISPNVTVSKGDNFTLSCNASGVPPPTIVWGHIDLVGFPENLKAFTNIKVEEGTLHVTGATNQQAGTFVCRASNSAGHADGRTYVTVLL